MAVQTILEAIRDALTVISTVQTCKIGIEPDISPDDYPMIRLVPSKVTPQFGGKHSIDLWIYYGTPLTTADDGGLEAIYAALFAMESDITNVMLGAIPGVISVGYQETVLDEDRLEQYKLFASRFDVTG